MTSDSTRTSINTYTTPGGVGTSDASTQTSVNSDGLEHVLYRDNQINADGTSVSSETYQSITYGIDSYRWNDQSTSLWSQRIRRHPGAVLGSHGSLTPPPPHWARTRTKRQQRKFVRGPLTDDHIHGHQHHSSRTLMTIPKPTPLAAIRPTSRGRTIASLHEQSTSRERGPKLLIIHRHSVMSCHRRYDTSSSSSSDPPHSARPIIDKTDTLLMPTGRRLSLGHGQLQRLGTSTSSSSNADTARWASEEPSRRHRNYTSSSSEQDSSNDQ